MIRAEIIRPGRTVPMWLRDALRVREPDYNMQEDGYALNGNIWRWWGHVEPHIDDLRSDELVLGYVLEAHGHKLVHGDQALTLEPGFCYVLDPHEKHGVLAPDRSGVLCCYVRSRPIAQRHKIDYEQFADEALAMAEALVTSPVPVFEE